MSKRVVIYARVSTNEQNCDRQVEELKQVVKTITGNLLILMLMKVIQGRLLQDQNWIE